MKKKLVTLAAITAFGATPAVALDQEEIDAMFSAPNAPKQEEVMGIAQKGGLIDIVTKDNKILRFNDEWTTLQDANGGDYHTLGATGVTRTKKTSFSDPEDVFTVSDYGLDQSKVDENGQLSLFASYLIDGPAKIDGISAATNPRKDGYDFLVLSEGNLYESNMVDGVLVVDTTPVDSIDAAVVGFDNMNGGKRATVTNNDYTLTKEKDGRVIFERSTDLQPGETEYPIIIAPGEACSLDLIAAGEQACQDGYVCKANDYPIKYNCLLE
ncbi:hypothetical protein C0585_03260 [Candidatus Woesearchaeota archaeon]|nr:MAG: hypothetical protein C0585_03260 [Candidatus Woesearchaeota archaeon]